MGADEQVRWWGYRRGHTWALRASMWYLLAMCLPLSLACLTALAPWVVIPAAFLVIAWLWARTSAVAIGIDGAHLYLRRLFLGRLERIPISEIRRCLVLRGSLQTRLRIYGPWRLWLTILHTSLPLGPAVPDWNGLLRALRPVFQRLGKWEEVTHWWW